MNNELQWDTQIDSVFDAFPEIETERLLLRCLEPEDDKAIYRVFSNPIVTRYYDLETIHDISEARGLIDFFIECFEVEKAIRWSQSGKRCCDAVRHHEKIGYLCQIQGHWP